MTGQVPSPSNPAVPARGPQGGTHARFHEVVACLVSHADRALLLRRSTSVGSERGLWSCVTGFCEPDTTPLEQALRELHEEVGLAPADLRLIARIDPYLHVGGDGSGWSVHAFHFGSRRSDVALNWEHDELRWVADLDDPAIATVPWLGSMATRLSMVSLCIAI